MKYKVFIHGIGDPIFMSWNSQETKLEHVVQEVWAELASTDYYDFEDSEGYFRIRTSLVSKVLVRKY